MSSVSSSGSGETATTTSKAATGPRVLRRTPCSACLVLLANWVPDDGQPPLCYKGDDRYRSACARCQHFEKKCNSTGSDDADVLATLAADENPNVPAIKQLQANIRRGLMIDLAVEFEQIFKDRNEIEDEENRGHHALMFALKAVVDRVHGLEIGARTDLRHELSILKTLVEHVLDTPPESCVEQAVENLGLI